VTPPAAAAPAVAGRRVGARNGAVPAMRPARRVSGPARRPAPARAAGRLQRRGGLLLELLSRLERLAGHPLLDRLLRGRVWLGLVTFALIGIVTLQLALLKLNGAVGRTLAHESVLQRENAALSIEDSEIAAADRVQARAAQLGMEFASPSALRSLSSNPSADLRRSASVLGAPARGTGSSGEETTAARGASPTGEGTEAAGGEASASEAGRASEAGGSGAASAGSEAGSRQPSPSGTGEAAAAPAQAEGSPAAAASPAGGTQASPNG
jgi:cell division protein FtsL